MYSLDYDGHRAVWERAYGVIPDGLWIDHINENKSDNRLENLQLVTPAQNKQRSTYAKGYRFHKGSRKRPYEANRQFNKKNYYLGHFGTPCGAKMAWNNFFIGGNCLLAS